MFLYLPVSTFNYYLLLSIVILAYVKGLEEVLFAMKIKLTTIIVIIKLFFADMYSPALELESCKT